MKPIPTERRKSILKDINKWNDHSRRSKVECLDFLHRQTHQTQTPCPGNRTQTKTPDATLEKSREQLPIPVCPQTVANALCLGSMLWGEWRAKDAVDVFLVTKFTQGLEPLTDYLKDAEKKVDAIRP